MCVYMCICRVCVSVCVHVCVCVCVCVCNALSRTHVENQQLTRDDILVSVL